MDAEAPEPAPRSPGPPGRVARPRHTCLAYHRALPSCGVPVLYQDLPVPRSASRLPTPVVSMARLEQVCLGYGRGGQGCLAFLQVPDVAALGSYLVYFRSLDRAVLP